MPLRSDQPLAPLTPAPRPLTPQALKSWFAVMGLPLPECTQQFSYMKKTLREELFDSMLTHGTRAPPPLIRRAPPTDRRPRRYPPPPPPLLRLTPLSSPLPRHVQAPPTASPTSRSRRSSV